MYRFMIAVVLTFGFNVAFADQPEYIRVAVNKTITETEKTQFTRPSPVRWVEIDVSAVKADDPLVIRNETSAQAFFEFAKANLKEHHEKIAELQKNQEILYAQDAEFAAKLKPLLEMEIEFHKLQLKVAALEESRGKQLPPPDDKPDKIQPKPRQNQPAIAGTWPLRRGDIVLGWTVGCTQRVKNGQGVVHLSPSGRLSYWPHGNSQIGTSLIWQLNRSQTGWERLNR